MKRIITLTLILTLVTGGMIYYSHIDSNEGQPLAYAVKDKAQMIKPAMAYLNKLRQHPKTGKLERKDIYSALHTVEQLSKDKQRGSRNLSLDWEEMGPDNVGGRTRAVLVDQNNHSRIFAGGVSGGLWISENAGQSWSVVPGSDLMISMAVTCIVQAPNGDIYFGTGEGDLYDAFDDPGGGIPGQGMWKSTDGGATFNHLSSTVPTPNSNYDSWSNISKLAIDPANSSKIFASTTGGLVVSTDGGDTWEQANGTPVIASTDVKIGSDGTIYSSIGDRYYRSDDDGSTFTDVTNDAFGVLPGTVNRLEFAVSPSDPNYVYVNITKSTTADPPLGECIYNIYQSKNKGLDWTIIGPGGSDEFDPFGNNAQCQGSYNNAIAVSPDDRETIYVGGVDLWKWSADKGWLKADVWFVGASLEFQFPYYVHADKHAIVFHPNDGNIMYIGTDGGVFKSENAMAIQPEFINTNKGFNTTQYYAITASIDGFIMGGLQDNGTRFIDYTGNTTKNSKGVFSGDGGYAAISRVNPNIFFCGTPPSPTEAGRQGGNVYRSANKGQTFVPFFDSNIDCTPFVPNTNECQGDDVPDDGSDFVTPFVLWEDPVYDNAGQVLIDSSTSRLFLLTSHQLWMCEDAAINLFQPSWFQLNTITMASGFGTVTALAVTPDGKTAFVGNSSGRVYRITGIDLPTYKYDHLNNWDNTGLETEQIGGNLSALITDITIDPNDDGHIVITTGAYGITNHVYESDNAMDAAASVTISSIHDTGTLPSMPVYAAVISAANRDHIILGTEFGIFSSTDGGTTWEEDNGGLARVPVFDLQQLPLYEDHCYVIYAGTHGRGVYRTTTLTASGCKTDIRPGIAEKKTYEAGFKLYPNPMRNQTTLNLNTNQVATVVINIYDVQGTLVRSIDKGMISAGEHNFQISRDRLSAGSYIVHVQADEELKHGKLIVVD